MTLVLSVVLGILPLLGIVWMILGGAITTVDGLFMSLILLALSGILFLNAALELRKPKLANKNAAPQAQKTS